MLWFFFLAIVILSWTAYDIFFKVMGDNFNYFLALLVIGFFQMLMALPFVIFYFLNGSLNYTGRGFYLSALMGLLLGAGTIFFFYTFKLGTPFAAALPIYYVGSLLVATAAGLLIFKETLTPLAWAGVVLGVISITLLTIK